MRWGGSGVVVGSGMGWGGSGVVVGSGMGWGACAWETGSGCAGGGCWAAARDARGPVRSMRNDTTTARSRIPVLIKAILLL
jgi:hypothetical protein